MTFGAFGCSLDVLDAPEKLAMKLAYMNALRQGLITEDVARDPYDLLIRALEGTDGLVTIGRLEIEPWLAPRPSLEALERVDAAMYMEFLDAGGCEVLAARIREFVLDRVLPREPLLIGVDHSLTGGVLEALQRSGEQDLGLIVLDSHFDAIPASVRRAAAVSGEEDDAKKNQEIPDSYSCGNWLGQVIGRGFVKPQNIVVVGPSDLPPEAAETAEMAEFRRAYAQLEEQGVRVIPKQRVRDVGAAEAAREAVGAMDCASFYVSVDADVGAGDEVKAVRFLDTIGLEPDEVVSLCGGIAREIASKGSRLAGLDMMEIDVHLADIPDSGDRTLEMCASAARAVMSETRG